MSSHPHPQRERKQKVDFEDMYPELLLPLLPGHVRRALKPVKHRPKKKNEEAKKTSPKKAAAKKKTPAKKAPAKKTTAKKAVAAKKKPAPKKGPVKKPSASASSLFSAPHGGTVTTSSGVEVTGFTLSREESAAAEVLARRGTQTHKWQYQTDSGFWANYDASASVAVEIAYASWLLDPHIDVRSVKSGDWEYMIDFNMLTQQNVKHSAHKVRKIQRVPVSA